MNGQKGQGGEAAVFFLPRRNPALPMTYFLYEHMGLFSVTCAQTKPLVQKETSDF